MIRFDLILIGFGHVARRFVTLAVEQRARLETEHEVSTRVVGIVTRRHGSAYSADGLDAVSLADRLAAGGDLGPAPAGPAGAAIAESLAKSAGAARDGRLVLVETTTLDARSGEPAIGHIRAALEAGAHAITVNKGPIAFAYRDLADRAERAGRRLLFEGTVMDGVPVFNLARETLPAVRVLGFRGVLNSTTNYMLTAMERGKSFAGALAEMQAAGIAEADASLDVDGWDAAAKAAALANVLLDARVTPLDVTREGISAASGRRAADARQRGRRLKLVARGRRQSGSVVVGVAPEELPADDLLAGLDGGQNALVLETDVLDEIAIVQRGGGLTATAYALVSDLVRIAGASPRAPR
jgi:homoserine dehydrogenase